jgi:putative N6-adenine-specific DNA methylase
MKKVLLIATSTFGLEALVRREVEAMGFTGVKGADGKIEFEARSGDIPRLNINLRTADRVLLKVGEFAATDFGQLFDLTKMLPWEDWITPEAKITVTGKSVRSVLESVRSCQSIVKKAIVDRLMSRLKTGILPETGDEIVIQVAILKDVVQLTLDTSGNGLHKRGYRAGTGEVPLRENLAAALVMLSFWDKDRFLLDPMCGSGTILIEAAMMARNIAPGLKRSFASETWPVIGPEAWAEARRTALAAVRPSGGLQIRGYDVDPERVLDGQANARKAGVDGDIIFEQRDVRALALNEEYGIIISNPPYGMKLGSYEDLPPIYKAIDAVLKDKKGWSLYMLTADRRFPEFFKRGKPDKVRKLFNGTIEVQYYQYFGARPARERA